MLISSNSDRQRAGGLPLRCHFRLGGLGDLPSSGTYVAMSAGALHQAALVAANSRDWYSYSNLAALLTVAGVTCDEDVVKFMIARSPALRSTLDLSLNATGVYHQLSDDRFR
jgi:hypothetical protein